MRDSGKYRTIVIIFGNHDLHHLGNNKSAFTPVDHQHHLAPLKAKLTRGHDSPACPVHVLIMQEVEVCGLRIYGSSWWSGRAHDGRLSGKARGSECFDTVPSGIDVLLTHGPPTGGWKVPELPDMVKRVQPGVHLYGHTHYCNNDGAARKLGRTLTVNSAMCREHNELCQPAHLIAGRPGGPFRIVQKIVVSPNKKKHVG